MSLSLLPKGRDERAVSVLLALCSVLISAFSVAFVKTAQNYAVTGDDLMPNLGARSFLVIGVLAVFVFLIFTLLHKGKLDVLCELAYRHRFVIGVLIVVLCTALEISGSSVAAIGGYIGENGTDGVLFGIPRAVRSDEWRVFTPFAFSQEYSGYASVSSVLRGTATDVTMVYAQPCWSFATLFRPFLWGYLVLGSTRGLAFFWSARLVALFLVNETFAQLLFGKDRRVSVAFALLVSFGGVVQWWFAVNGTAELFVFGELLVIAFDWLIRSDRNNRWGRLGLSVAIAWLCVCFVMIMYPAWQVVLFWVFFALGVARAVSYVNDGNTVKDLFIQLRPMLFSILLMGVASVACMVPALDVIKSVGETVYPGKRSDLGGEFALAQFFNWAKSLSAPLSAGSYLPNVCECSSFFSATPLGGFLALIASVRCALARKRVDPVLVGLAIVEIVFIIFCFVGLPGILASISLLSHSTEGRVWQMTGFLDLILVFRVATKYEEWHVQGFSPLLCVSVALACAFSFACAAFADSFRISFMVLAAVAMACLLTSMLFIHFNISGASWALFSVAVLVALSGAAVNPVQQGAPALLDGQTASAVKGVNASDDIWVADGSLLGDLCIANGASCINSVNTYPQLNTWKKLDPKGKFERCYNRYAHISIEATTGKVSFEVTAADSITVKLNLDDARKIGVTKWLTSTDLTQFATDTTRAVKVCDAGPFAIYELRDANA